VASNAHVVLALAAAAVSAGKHHEGKTSRNTTKHASMRHTHARTMSHPLHRMMRDVTMGQAFRAARRSWKACCHLLQV
jgi:hypothetical protein